MDKERRLRELALFAGGGGGILGSALLGHQIVCAVEWDAYCQAVLLQRQKDGHLPAFPIWDDVRTFDGKPWAGHVDVVSGGFPCQPFSQAGKQKGSADDRNMWPDTIRIIREVRPRFAFLENVPGLLSWDGGSYFGQILRDLHEAGYDAEWDVIGADDVGAPHRRKRLWVLAHAKLFGRVYGQPEIKPAEAGFVTFGDAGAESEVADTDSAGISPGRENRGVGREQEQVQISNANAAGRQEHEGSGPVQAEHGPSERSGDDVPDPAGVRRRSRGTEPEGLIGEAGASCGSENVAVSGGGRCGRRPDIERAQAARGSGAGQDGEDVADSQGQPVGPGLRPGRSGGKRGRRLGDGGCKVAHPQDERDGRGDGRDGDHEAPVGSRGHHGGGEAEDDGGEWWDTEPLLGRVADGVAHRVDRLKALGNGQVPTVVRLAWNTLMSRILEPEEER